MSQRNVFIAIKDDFPDILELLEKYSYRTLNNDTLELSDLDFVSEVVLCFPQYGEIVYWPDPIDVSLYKENSDEWKSAIMTRQLQVKNQKVKYINSFLSPVASFVVPKLRHNSIWSTGAINFHGLKLKERFPEFHKIIGKMNRDMKKMEIISDTTKRDCFSKYSEQLCLCSIVQKIFSFSNAIRNLEDGGYYTDYMCTDFVLDKYFKQLRLKGINAPEI